MPPALTPATLAVVALGGAAGTGTRALLAQALPPGDGLPVATLLVNVTGALALGLLLGALARLGPDEGRRRTLRLGAGTGFLGGYTTYSSFVLETLTLGRADRLGLAAAYDAVSLTLGLLAALAGLALGDRLAGRAR